MLEQCRCSTTQGMPHGVAVVNNILLILMLFNYGGFAPPSLLLMFVSQVELFTEVLESCANVLKKDPDNVKALFRSGKVRMYTVTYYVKCSLKYVVRVWLRFRSIYIKKSIVKLSSSKSSLGLLTYTVLVALPPTRPYLLPQFSSSCVSVNRSSLSGTVATSMDF